MPPTPPALSSSTGGEGGGKHGGMEETRAASLARAEAQDLSFHGSEYSHDGSEGKNRRSPRNKLSRAYSSASSQPREPSPDMVVRITSNTNFGLRRASEVKPNGMTNLQRDSSTWSVDSDYTGPGPNLNESLVQSEAERLSLIDKITMILKEDGMEGGSPSGAAVKRDGDASFPKEMFEQLAGDGGDGSLQVDQAWSAGGGANARPAVTRILTEPSLKVSGPAEINSGPVNQFHLRSMTFDTGSSSQASSILTRRPFDLERDSENKQFGTIRRGVAVAPSPVLRGRKGTRPTPRMGGRPVSPESVDASVVEAPVKPVLENPSRKSEEMTFEGMSNKSPVNSPVMRSSKCSTKSPQMMFTGASMKSEDQRSRASSESARKSIEAVSCRKSIEAVSCRKSIEAVSCDLELIQRSLSQRSVQDKNRINVKRTGSGVPLKDVQEGVYEGGETPRGLSSLGKSTAGEAPGVPGGPSASTGKALGVDDAEELLKAYDGSLVLRTAEGGPMSTTGKASILKRRADKNENGELHRRTSSGDGQTTQRKNSSLDDADAEGETEYVRGYAFTDAVIIPMNDILDNGQPPPSRAGNMTRVMDLLIFIQDLKHIPTVPGGGNTSHYNCEVTFNDDSKATEVKPGSHELGCVWMDRFTMKVHDFHIQMARQSFENPDDDGPLIECSVYDCGRYQRNDLIGRLSIRLKDVLPFGEESEEFSVEYNEPLYGDDGEPVTGVDGIPTLLNVIFKPVLTNTEDGWKPPDLEETLRVCESNIRLGDVPVGLNIDTLADQAKRSSMDDVDWAVGGNFSMAADKSLRAELKQRKYWRESLENILDSLLFTTGVLMLVVIDVCQLLLYQFLLPQNDDGSEPVPQRVLTITVLGLFWVELTMRQIAKGGRFYREGWNLFDLFVIYGSCIVMVTRYSLEGFGANDVNVDDFQNINLLRIISRVAIGMRVIRVFIWLRRARKLSGRVTQSLRVRVSQNRRRYQLHGFDLDLTYITDRVIAMSAPAFGGHSAYRNDIHLVSRFLSFRHYGGFFVFNLCDTYNSSDGVMGNYNHDMLFNQVMRIPFEDHCPPLLCELLQFCREAQRFLTLDERNVIAVHCKGGKGRTGVFIASILLWTGHRRCAVDALELFTFRRTENYDPGLGLEGDWQNTKSPWQGRKCNQTVEGPSQIRYVHYLEATLYSGIDPATETRTRLNSISLPVGRMQAAKTWHISVVVRIARSVIFDSFVSNNNEPIPFTGNVGDVVTINVDHMVWGDLRVDVYKHKAAKNGCWSLVPPDARKHVCFMCMHVSFYPDVRELIFPKRKLDILSKDKLDKKADSNFFLHLAFDSNIKKQSLMQYEEDMRNIFMEFGTRRSIPKGEIYRPTAEGHKPIALLVQGTMDGLVEEVAPDSKAIFSHPLGACIPGGNDNINKNRSTVDMIGGDDKLRRIRRPNILLAGADSVISCSPFLSDAPCTLFEARTHCEVYELYKTSDSFGKISKLKAKGGFIGRVQKALNRTSVKSRMVDGVDLAIGGLSNDQLYQFYYGLSITLAARWMRTRTEAIRISECKAFNDRQTVLGDHDETEALRVKSIKAFSFPISEKVQHVTKCAVRSVEFEQPHIRLIVFSNYLVLDPEYYGPEINPRKSHVVPLPKLRAVNPVRTASSSKVILSVMGQSVEGLEIEANVTKIEFDFHSHGEMISVYNLMSIMCRKAENTREREKFKPFETPYMRTLLEGCCKVHHIKEKEIITGAKGSRNDSLFLVRSGEIRLVTEAGDVFKLIQPGGCFGEIAFALCQTSIFMAEAVQKSTVLEIQQSALKRFIQADKLIGARFYYILSEVIEKNLRETLEEIFPGTWCVAKSDAGSKNKGRASNASLATSSVRRTKGAAIENRKLLLLQKQAQALQVKAEAETFNLEVDMLTSSQATPMASPGISRTTSTETPAKMGKNASLWKVKQLRAPALSRDVSQHSDNDLLGEVEKKVTAKVTAKDLQNFDVYLGELQKESERLKNKMTTKGSGVLRRTASTLIQSLTPGSKRELGAEDSSQSGKRRPLYVGDDPDNKSPSVSPDTSGRHGANPPSSSKSQSSPGFFKKVTNAFSASAQFSRKGGTPNVNMSTRRASGKSSANERSGSDSGPAQRERFLSVPGESDGQDTGVDDSRHTFRRSMSLPGSRENSSHGLHDSPMMALSNRESGKWDSSAQGMGSTRDNSLHGGARTDSSGKSPKRGPRPDK